MKNRYQKVMENIQVTEELHDSIIKSLNEEDSTRIQKINRVKQYKKWLLVASCFMILGVAGVVVGPNLMKDTQGEVEQIPNIIEVKTLEELQKQVGFRVEEVKELPFEVTKTIYTAYWNELAQITYDSGLEQLIYRKGLGDNDISGNYNSYSVETVSTINGVEITMKGNQSGYVLITWSIKGYSYSLDFTRSCSKEEIMKVVQRIIDSK